MFTVVLPFIHSMAFAVSVIRSHPGGPETHGPLMCCHTVSSSLTLHHDASVIVRMHSAMSAHPMGILSHHDQKDKYSPVKYSERDHIQITFIITCCFNHSTYS